MVGDLRLSAQGRASDYRTFTNQDQSRNDPNFDEDANPYEEVARNSSLRPYEAPGVSPQDHHEQYTLFTICKQTSNYDSVHDENLYLSANSSLIPRPRSLLLEYGPTFLILLSTVITATVGCLVRYLVVQRNVPAALIACLKGVVEIIILTCTIITMGVRDVVKKPTKTQLVLLSIFAFCTAVNLDMRYAALGRLPVGITASLIATAPIFCSVLAWVILGQTLTFVDVLSVCLTTVGSTILGFVNPNPEQAHNTDVEVHVEGVIMALLAAVMLSICVVVVKRLGTSVHFLLITLISGYSFLIGGFIALAIQEGSITDAFATLKHIVRDSDTELRCCLITATVLGVCASLCIICGSQFLAPGRVGVLRTTEIPINFLLGFILLHEFPKSLAIFGGCLFIAISTVLTALNGTS